MQSGHRKERVEREAELNGPNASDDYKLELPIGYLKLCGSEVEQILDGNHVLAKSLVCSRCNLLSVIVNK